jgi:anti-sigma B factor antagonist
VTPVTSALFDVRTAAAGPQAELKLVGELDMGTAGRLREALERALDEGATTVVVDLSALTFMDSTGLQELAMARRRHQARGGDVVLQAPTARIRRVLHIVGFDQLFTIR